MERMNRTNAKTRQMETWGKLWAAINRLAPSRSSTSRPASACVRDGKMRPPSATSTGGAQGGVAESRPSSAIRRTTATAPSITPLDGGGGPIGANADFHLGPVAPWPGH
ncbi:hypothetical protein Ctob_012528 [Chrysochromulina tobinii]|uniref:Uncharacterized protein n=1 Tax=Chrysochromulina tobinii TaxID=1460289 RepID=A0A0M0JYF8_9EUKA|nr:hypothetical protein Ctob_012528 [Chrysochromulina tobinii]|eukprot:KOO31599.1 hypothetical protein Ctob_012528 [Chrysochromulina sp. CCMP291]